MQIKLQLFTLILLATTTTTSWSQTDSTQSSQLQWGVSAGVNQYKEPDLMQLKGPEVGLHARLKNSADLQVEADLLLGKQRYTSTNSGNLDNVTNLETRWRVITPIFTDSATGEGFYTGLAIHTLWNDLRGKTSANKYGYERISGQLWLPVRWSSGDVWDVEAGLLIYGRHTSKLSQVNNSYSDIVNTQRRGQYAQVSLNLKLHNRESLKPYVRYTHLADSNKVEMGGFYWLEPESHRWQVGAVWEFNTR